MRDFCLPGRSVVHSRTAMAATSHPLATQVATDVLKAGGNALDAAIAANAMLCVVEPGMTGIGGDCFVMLAKQGQLPPIAYNGSGRTPAAASLENLLAAGKTEIARDTAEACIVPGAVDAWTTVHRDHGHMPFAELLQPAIHAAKNGFPVAPKVHFDIAKQRDYLVAHPSTGAIFLVDGEAPPVGSVMRLPALAEALNAIACEGRDAFYHAHLAKDIVTTLQELGGCHELSDFAKAQGNYVDPISAEFRGRTVYQCPPNGQGAIALLLLNIFKEIAPDSEGPVSLQRIHHELEACRLAYAARDAYVADGDRTTAEQEAMASRLEHLLSAGYASKLRSAIQSSSVNSALSAMSLAEHKDTVYISVVDKDRNACSFINTLFYCFGSGITTPSGVTLTNRGISFSLDPKNPNCYGPNKRPMHTIIPGMTGRNGKVDLCYGVMGGHYQAMGHLQFLTRYFDFGCDVQEAIDLPRWMVNPATQEVEIESTVPSGIRDELGALGHRFASDVSTIGGAQAIAIDWQNGVLAGGSDARKDGCAMGY